MPWQWGVLLLGAALLFFALVVSLVPGMKGRSKDNLVAAAIFLAIPYLVISMGILRIGIAWFDGLANNTATMEVAFHARVADRIALVLWNVLTAAACIWSYRRAKSRAQRGACGVRP